MAACEAAGYTSPEVVEEHCGVGSAAAHNISNTVISNHKKGVTPNSNGAQNDSSARRFLQSAMEEGGKDYHWDNF